MCIMKRNVYNQSVTLNNVVDRSFGMEVVYSSRSVGRRECDVCARVFSEGADLMRLHHV